MGAARSPGKAVARPSAGSGTVRQRSKSPFPVSSIVYSVMCFIIIIIERVLLKCR